MRLNRLAHQLRRRLEALEQRLDGEQYIGLVFVDPAEMIDCGSLRLGERVFLDYYTRGNWTSGRQRITTDRNDEGKEIDPPPEGTGEWNASPDG